MAKTICVDLSTRSIDQAIREIQAYKRDLHRKTALLVEALTDTGVDIAKAHVRSLGAEFTGGLSESITGFFSPSTGVGIVRANAPYAVYVEFGTGVVGAGSPHPAPEGWKYDVNSHGELGWWYYNDYDQKWHWTKGMESRPFMFYTARDLEAMCARVAREVFSG